MTEKIITLAGRAKQVFRELELAARYRGEITLKDLAEPESREFEFDEQGALNEMKERRE